MAMMSMSPTVTSPAMTAAAVILGTAAYMSPEQARGKPVDKRTDIWAFGCVLFELVTGTRAFAGETVSDTVAAILTRDPDWTKLPPQTPDALWKLLRRCLEKNPARRLRDAGDVELELEAATEPQPQSVERHAPAAGRNRAVWFVATVLAVVAAFAAGLTLARRTSATISMMPRLSPDGTTVAFIAIVDGQTQVAVMKPQSGNWQVLTRDRTRGIAQQVTWSADGTKLFFDRYPRRLVPIKSGTLRSITASPDGKSIYYVLEGQIWSVPAAGGEPTKFRQGDFVAADPNGGALVVLLNEAAGVRLVRVPLAQGGDRADMAGPGWDSAGRLVVPALLMQSNLWRFSPQPTPNP